MSFIYLKVRHDMMIPAKIQLVVYYVTIIGIERSVRVRAQIKHPSYGNRSQSSVREIYHTTDFSRDNQRESRTSTDIPISFKAPDIGSQNFWNYYTPSSSNRRTFLGDLGYFNYGKTNLFPDLNSFFDFMNPLLDKGNIFRPTPSTVAKSVSEPYRYEYPYDFRQTTDRNFLPPPKPIRASIVKLETITRPPGPFDYTDPTENPYISNFKPIPTGKPGSLYIDELGFHSAHNFNFKPEPDWNSRPQGLSTNRFTNNISSTIYIPSSAEVHHHRIRVQPSTKQKFLANNTLNNDTDEQLLTTTDNITLEEESNNTTSRGNYASNEESEKKFTSSARHKTGEHTTFGGKNSVESHNVTLVKNDDSKSGAVGSVEETASIRSEKPYKRGNSIKIVTELTLQGLSKNNKQMANIPRYTKFINMSGVINYELNKLKQNKVMKPRLDETEEKKEFLGPGLGNLSFADVNANDELSLDLKILKDTNWDGFTTEITTSTDWMEINSTAMRENYGKPIINAEINLQRNSDKGNNSEANYTTKNEDISNSKTIIVETRVTKSVTKALPHRRIHKKLHSTNRSGETFGNIKNQASLENNGLRNQTSKRADSQSEIVPQLNIGEDYNSSDFALSYNVSNHTENTEIFNETITEKYLSAPRGNEMADNSRRFNFTHRSENGINAKTIQAPYTFLDNLNGEAHNNDTTHEIKEHFDVENDSYPSPRTENVNSSNVTEIRKKARLNIRNKTEHSEIKSIHKRKPKRGQKTKRRRTGKRRQNNTVATEKTNGGLINIEMKIL